MTLASDLKRQLIKDACRSHRWQLSGKSMRWLVAIGISHQVVIQALIKHIDDGCLNSCQNPSRIGQLPRQSAPRSRRF